MPPDAVEIRPFEPADAQAVSALLRRVFDEQAPLMLEAEGRAAFRAHTAGQAIAERARTSQVFVAWQGLQPAGVIEVQASGRVALLFVRASAMGLGVAAGLVVRAAEACRSAGQASMTVSTSLDAQAFYKDLGFVPAGEPQQGNGLAFVSMEKKL